MLRQATMAVSMQMVVMAVLLCVPETFFICCIYKKLIPAMACLFSANVPPVKCLGISNFSWLKPKRSLNLGLSAPHILA
jgi:hypothetical protein